MGFKSAMLENGVNEDVVDGFLKEAEELYKESANFGALLKGMGGLFRGAEGIGAGLKGMATGEGAVGKALSPIVNYGRNVANEYRGGLNGIPREVPHGGAPEVNINPAAGEALSKGTKFNYNDGKTYTYGGTDEAGGHIWTNGKNVHPAGGHITNAFNAETGIPTGTGSVAGNTAAAEAATGAKPGFMGPGFAQRRLNRAGQGAMWGAGLGAIGGLPGMAIGGALGAGAGALGRVGVGALGAGALLGGGSLLGSGGKDRYGLPNDRNRLLPFMNNQLTGAVGGGILGSVLENAGVPGGALLPLIGAAGGYHFLPQVMNNTSDPLGSGANSVQYPLMHSGQ